MARTRRGTARARRAVQRKQGVLLDISLGGTPQSGSVTCPEIYWDPRTLPCPLEDGVVHTAVVTHVLEYLDPRDWYAWWDELHRIVRPDGVVLVSGPYGGDESRGWLADPTHRVRVVEETFAWLDTATPVYAFHETLGRPAPKPWQLVSATRVPAPFGAVSYNVTLRRR